MVGGAWWYSAIINSRVLWRKDFLSAQQSDVCTGSSRCPDDPCALLLSPHAVRGAAGKATSACISLSLSLSKNENLLSCTMAVMCTVLLHFLTRHASRMPAHHPLTTQPHTRRVPRLRRGVRSTRSERGLWSCRNTQTQGTCARTATNIRGPPSHKISFQLSL